MKHQHLSTAKARPWAKAGLIAARVKPRAGFASGLLAFICFFLWFILAWSAAAQIFQGPVIFLAWIFIVLASVATLAYSLAIVIEHIGSSCAPADSKQFVELIKRIKNYGDLRALVLDWINEDGPDGVQVRDYKAIMTEVSRRDAQQDAITQKLAEEAAALEAEIVKQEALASISSIPEEAR